MRLLRCGPKGHEKPAILDDSGITRDLSGVVEDITGATLDERTLDHLRGMDLSTLPVVPAGERIGPCVGNVGKFVCVGLNYSDHARESGLPIPTEPVLFTKATSSISGPNDPIQTPRGSTKLDWEAELGIVIGTEAKYISEKNAIAHVAGYCVVHDVSERAFQTERQGQWVKGKSCDTFGPVGPWLVTRDDVPDPQALGIWLNVNGNSRQKGSTSTMIFSVTFIVSYISQFMSLQPGDIISTGTPPGVGMGMKPPTYLKADDVVTLGVDGLGEQRQTVLA